MFKAQLLKDSALAYKVHSLNQSWGPSDRDRFMVLCSTQNMAYGFGVPERIWMKDFTLAEKTYMVYVGQANKDDLKKFKKSDYEYELVRKFGSNLPPADLCFFTEQKKEFLPGEKDMHTVAKIELAKHGKSATLLDRAKELKLHKDPNDIVLYYITCPDRPESKRIKKLIRAQTDMVLSAHKQKKPQTSENPEVLLEVRVKICNFMRLHKFVKELLGLPDTP